MARYRMLTPCSCSRVCASYQMSNSRRKPEVNRVWRRYGVLSNAALVYGIITGGVYHLTSSSTRAARSPGPAERRIKRQRLVRCQERYFVRLRPRSRLLDYLVRSGVFSSRLRVERSRSAFRPEQPISYWNHGRCHRPQTASPRFEPVVQPGWDTNQVSTLPPDSMKHSSAAGHQEMAAIVEVRTQSFEPLSFIDDRQTLPPAIFSIAIRSARSAY